MVRYSVFGMSKKKLSGKVSLYPRHARESASSPLAIEGRLASMVKVEVYSEDGFLEFESPWYPNLITNRFLEAFGEKTFQNVNDLREYLVIGVSNDPKPEIKRSSGAITGTYSNNNGQHLFEASASFFSQDTNWEGWELVIPSTGAYARILSRVSNTVVEIDRAINANDVQFSVWNVNADLPATDRLDVVNTTEGTPQSPIFGFNSGVGAYEFHHEILRVYTVPQGDPIKFSSFAFVPTNTYNSGDPTNAMIYELVRDISGSPTVITLAPGKKIKIRHLLRAMAFVQNNLQVELRQFDLADNLVATNYLDATNTLSTPSTPPSSTDVQSIFTRLLSPASDLIDGESDAVVELAPLDANGSPVNSLKKSFTATTLHPYTAGSYSRSRSVLLGEGDFVATIYGIKTTFLKGGTEHFSLTTRFGQNLSITKDDLHELRVHILVRWYRYYSA